MVFRGVAALHLYLYIVQLNTRGIILAVVTVVAAQPNDASVCAAALSERQSELGVGTPRV